MMVMNLNGALLRRILDQAEGVRLGINPVGLADKGHVTHLASFCAAGNLIDIGFAEPGNFNLPDITDLEVGVQRRGRLIVAVGFQLNFAFLTQFEAGNQRKGMWPQAAGLLIVFQREGQNNAVVVFIMRRQSPRLIACETV
ncbi:hypothetical protein D3C81_1447470 [compost metagenome]